MELLNLLSTNNKLVKFHSPNICRMQTNKRWKYSQSKFIEKCVLHRNLLYYTFRPSFEPVLSVPL